MLTAALKALQVQQLPGTPEQAATYLASLPSQIGTLAVSDRGPQEVRYGRGTTVTVQPLAEAAGAQVEMTDFFTQFVRSGGFVVDQQRLEPEQVMFFVGKDTATDTSVVAWAAPQGKYLFAVEAADSGALTEAVTAALA